MKIGGFIKSSLIEYPGLISAAVFTQGCNFRCPYCHNPELVEPSLFSESISEDEIISFLGKRKNLLDGVVITGGEPTIHQELPCFLQRVKSLGLKTKLDTNGTNPGMILELICSNLIDYIAMDVKAPFDHYQEVCGVNLSTEAIQTSMDILSNSEIDVEFRTTAMEALHTEDDIVRIGQMIPEGKRFYLQRFEPSKTLDITYLQQNALSGSFVDSLKEKFRCSQLRFAVR